VNRDPRNTRQYRDTRKRVLAGATHCAKCRQPLDWNAPPKSSLSPSLDHIIPIDKGGSAFDPRNMQPMHYGCNSGSATGSRPLHLSPPPLVTNGHLAQSDRVKPDIHDNLTSLEQSETGRNGHCDPPPPKKFTPP
jgi:hypothetical protein